MRNPEVSSLSGNLSEQSIRSLIESITFFDPKKKTAIITFVIELYQSILKLNDSDKAPVLQSFVDALRLLEKEDSFSHDAFSLVVESYYSKQSRGNKASRILKGNLRDKLNALGLPSKEKYIEEKKSDFIKQVEAFCTVSNLNLPGAVAKFKEVLEKSEGLILTANAPGRPYSVFAQAVAKVRDNRSVYLISLFIQYHPNLKLDDLSGLSAKAAHRLWQQLVCDALQLIADPDATKEKVEKIQLALKLMSQFPVIEGADFVIRDIRVIDVLQAIKENVYASQFNQFIERANEIAKHYYSESSDLGALKFAYSQILSLCESIGNVNEAFRKASYSGSFLMYFPKVLLSKALAVYINESMADNVNEQNKDVAHNIISQFGAIVYSGSFPASFTTLWNAVASLKQAINTFANTYRDPNSHRDYLMSQFNVLVCTLKLNPVTIASACHWFKLCYEGGGQYCNNQTFIPVLEAVKGVEAAFYEYRMARQEQASPITATQTVQSVEQTPIEGNSQEKEKEKERETQPQSQTPASENPYAVWGELAAPSATIAHGSEKEKPEDSAFGYDADDNMFAL